MSNRIFTDSLPFEGMKPELLPGAQEIDGNEFVPGPENRALDRSEVEAYIGGQIPQGLEEVVQRSAAALGITNEKNRALYDRLHIPSISNERARTLLQNLDRAPNPRLHPDDGSFDNQFAEPGEIEQALLLGFGELDAEDKAILREAGALVGANLRPEWADGWGPDNTFEGRASVLTQFTEGHYQKPVNNYESTMVLPLRVDIEAGTISTSFNRHGENQTVPIADDGSFQFDGWAQVTGQLKPEGNVEITNYERHHNYPGNYGRIHADWVIKRPAEAVLKPTE